MEKELFGYGEVDPVTDMVVNFYTCKLKVPFGNLPIGAEFKTICIDFEHGFIEIHADDGESISCHELHLRVGRELTREEAEQKVRG